MKVLIFTLGTRGDVQPYVALGQRLIAQGHRAIICTSSRFESFIREHGVDYAYMNDRLLALTDSDLGREAIEQAGGLLGWLKVMAELTREVKPMQQQMLVEEWEAAKDGADVVLFHPKALGGAHIAEKLGVPGYLAVPLPIFTPTRAFANIVFPALRLGGGYNKLSFTLANRLARLQYGSIVNAWRVETLGLPRQKGSHDETTFTDGREVPTLYAYSPHVLPKPADWSANIHVTGYWFLPAREAYRPDEQLQAFLAAGPPPVYVGFGSMAGRSPAKVTTAVVAALKASGQRGIIATGWGGLSADDLPDSILKIAGAPHDWLFPKMAAVVHHGGAGTTAAGLRAGRPTVICPFFGDQPFWGRHVQALGVGSEPIPQKRLTGDRLAAAIKQVTGDSTIQSAAAALGEKLSAEDGIGNTVKVIAAGA